MFLKILFSKILYFLKMCPIFVGSVHNFGRSDSDINLGKNACFQFMHTYMVSCRTQSKISLKDSSMYMCSIEPELVVTKMHFYIT